MKYVVFTVTLNPRNGEFVHPFDAQEVQQRKTGPHIYSDGFRAKDMPNAKVLIAFEDDDYVRGRFQGRPGVQVLSDEDAADDWIAKNTLDHPTDRITDIEQIHLIIAKKAAGMTITQDDKDRLDPTKPGIGYNRKNRTATDWIHRGVPRGSRSR